MIASHYTKRIWCFSISDLMLVTLPKSEQVENSILVNPKGNKR